MSENYLKWDSLGGEQWKEGLIAFLDVGFLYLLDPNSLKADVLSEDTYRDSHYFEELISFMEACYPNGNVKETAPSILEFDGMELEYKVLLSERIKHIMVGGILQRLETYGLVDVCDISENDSLKEIALSGDNFKCKKYSLNEKGFESALKVIEHKDNEKRFNTQTDINQRMKRNSNISAFTSVAAFLAAVIALTFSYQRLQLMENTIVNKKAVIADTEVNKNNSKIPNVPGDDTNKKIKSD